MKLYEIAEQYRNLEALISDVDMPQELIKQALSTVEGDFSTKIDNICKYIKELENEADGIANEIKRLQERKKSKENTITSIKAYMFDQLKSLNMKSLKTPLFSVGIQNNPQSIKITNSMLIPNSYVVERQIKFDSKAILKDLKAGVVIEGVEIKEVTESLRIR